MAPRNTKQLGPSTALGRFLDGLLQSFEDRRPGLDSAALASGDAQVQQFFEEVYAAERPRLKESMRDHAPHLSDEARDKLYDEVDKLVSTMVIPAYVRTTIAFTPRERNSFYVVKEGLHGLERAGWGLAGILLGVFVIAAPFIPLWSKEWVGVFMLLGLFFPNLRSYLSQRKYERDLNDLVLRGEREVQRIDRAYLERGDTIAELRELTNAGEEVARALDRLAEAKEASRSISALAEERAPSPDAPAADPSDSEDLAKAREAADAEKQGQS